MWRDFFTLSKREQLAFMVMFIGLLLLISFYFVDFKTDDVEIDLELQAWIDTVESVVEESPKAMTYELFPFDPNTVKVKDMERLGLSRSTIINLIKYREAGGQIRSVRKFGEIYGIDSMLLCRLKPYFVIKENQSNGQYNNRVSYTKKPFLVDLNKIDSSTLTKWGVDDIIVTDILGKQQNYYFNDRIKKDLLLSKDGDSLQKTLGSLLIKKNLWNVSKDVFQIELNSADTAMLVLLNGIGPVLSKRILAYRKSIGGFYNVNQLQEVYGVSPLVIKDNKDVLKIDSTLIQPLNLAKASLRRMKEHPYLDFYMAKLIYESRKRGELHSIRQFFSEDAFVNIDEALFERYFVVSN